MTVSVGALAPALHALFTTDADRLARDTGLVRRRRRLDGPALARAVVLGWLARPDAPLHDLADDAAVSPQALARRLADAIDFLTALLGRAVARARGGRPEPAPLLRKFAGVYTEDLTDLGPGGGKALVRYELTTGSLDAVHALPANASEVPSSRALPPLPPGSLRLADRGFFDAGDLARMTAAGVYWVPRVPTGATVRAGGSGRFEGLADWLARQTADRVEVPAGVSEGGPVGGRLLARRCPPGVAADRLARLARAAKRKGRAVSARQRVLCLWTVYLTNLPGDAYGAAEVEVLYRCRWQIELLFKRFKSLGGVGASRGRSPERLLAEAVAKLLAAVVAEWVALLGGGPVAATGPVGRVRRVRRRAGELARVIGDVAAVAGVLSGVAAAFARLARRANRRSPSTRQLLFRPRLVA